METECIKCGGEIETVITALGPGRVCESCGEPEAKDKDE